MAGTSKRNVVYIATGFVPSVESLSELSGGTKSLFEVFDGVEKEDVTRTVLDTFANGEMVQWATKEHGAVDVTVRRNREHFVRRFSTLGLGHHMRADVETFDFVKVRI